MSSVCHSYVILVSLVCTRMPFVCDSYVLVYHPYVTRLYSYVIRMSLVCTLCLPYVPVCHLYVTCMYSYVIRMSLICTRMSSVCHSYVLVCHPYVTRMWFYHEPNHMKTRVNLKYFMTSCSNLICRVEFRRQNSRTRLLNYLK